MKYLFVVIVLSINSKSIAQEITFYASHPNITLTSSSPGHIWVGFSYSGENIKKGFYWNGLKDEIRKAEISYTYKVTLSQYKAAKRVIEKYKNMNYSLGSYDCRSFAESVAESIGLYTPDWGIISPGEWLGLLVQAND
ncbi:MAG: hypothetical protein MI974_29945 [Chitinophagales bacterium]|nr:hypothetical protein [Chitinophagales bacterium]